MGTITLCIFYSSDYEERYETAPTLPGKDYPDVEVEAQRSKGRSKKKPKSNSRLDKHRGVSGKHLLVAQ